MNSSNPYLPSTTVKAHRRSFTKCVLLFALSLVFFALAGTIYFRSEKWTFYTPYSSSESWQLELPGGIDFQFSASTGWAVLISLHLFGAISFLRATILLASAKTRKQ